MGRQFVNCKALYKCHVSELFYDNRNFSLEGQMSVFFYSSDSYAYPFSIDLKYSLSAYFMTAELETGLTLDMTGNICQLQNKKDSNRGEKRALTSL